jgi:hypothetical protein
MVSEIGGCGREPSMIACRISLPVLPATPSGVGRPYFKSAKGVIFYFHVSTNDVYTYTYDHDKTTSENASD